MLYKEFGSDTNPTIVLLHGGGLSWWSLSEVIDGLIGMYHVVAPIIDGHGEDGNTTFLSIEDSAQKLITYIDTHHAGKVLMLAGLSLGAQIVTEILSTRADIAEFAMIESALIYPIKGTTALTVPTFKMFYGLIQKKWFSKLQAKSLMVPDSKFDLYYQDSLKMSKETLINITLSNGNYHAKETLKKTKARVLILVGNKELGIMKKSGQTLFEMIPSCQYLLRDNLRHGESSLVRHAEFIQMIKSLVQQQL